MNRAFFLRRTELARGRRAAHAGVAAAGLLALLLTAACSDEPARSPAAGPQDASPDAALADASTEEAGAEADAGPPLDCPLAQRVRKFVDRDGDGFGARERALVCTNTPGHTSNAGDPDDDCAENKHDFCGVCQGDGSSCTLLDVLAWGFSSCVLNSLGSVQCLGGLNMGLPGGIEKCGNLPCTSSPVPVPGLAGAVQLSSVPGCALDAKGQVWCWGAANMGRKPMDGDEYWTDAHMVEGIAGASFVMARPEHNVCAVVGGTLRCWGSNLHGNLGDGLPHEDPSCSKDFKNKCSFVPVEVPGLPEEVIGVSLDSDATCAWTRHGKVYCWGTLTKVGLPGAPAGDVLTPLEVSEFGSVEQVMLSGGHGCVLAQGRVSCFGWSQRGALGVLPLSSAGAQPIKPIQGLPPVAELSGAGDSTCARTVAGDVYCWGANAYLIPGADAVAQTCETDKDCVPTPVRVPGLEQVTSLSLSPYHACALTANKQVWCWGGNNSMALGIAKGPDACRGYTASYNCSARPVRIW